MKEENLYGVTTSKENYLVKIDSIVYRDSIYYQIKNDTVLLTQKVYCDRWMKDTVRMFDTVRIEDVKTIVKRETVRKTDWRKTIVYSVIGTALLGLMMAVLITIKRIRR